MESDRFVDHVRSDGCDDVPDSVSLFDAAYEAL